MFFYSSSSSDFDLNCYYAPDLAIYRELIGNFDVENWDDVLRDVLLYRFPYLIVVKVSVPLETIHGTDMLIKVPKFGLNNELAIAIQLKDYEGRMNM